jgi:ubiquinone/menaquinone biosynthesis C-methylase UbiE
MDRFATVETLREIRRVLKPGGGLGMIWNVDDCACRFTVRMVREEVS